MMKIIFCNLTPAETYCVNSAYDQIKAACLDSRFIPYTASAAFSLNPGHPLLHPANEWLSMASTLHGNILEFSDCALFAFYSRKIARFQHALTYRIMRGKIVPIPTLGFFAKPAYTPWDRFDTEDGMKGSRMLKANLILCVPDDETLEIRLSEMEESGELEALWCDETSGSSFSIFPCDNLLSDIEKAVRAAQHDLAILENQITVGYVDEQFSNTPFGHMAA